MTIEGCTIMKLAACSIPKGLGEVALTFPRFHMAQVLSVEILHEPQVRLIFSGVALHPSFKAGRRPFCVFLGLKFLPGWSMGANYGIIDCRIARLYI